ncbi:MAG: PA0069 family radical SAM protein, partial [Sphingomonadaceae bacterium]
MADSPARHVHKGRGASLNARSARFDDLAREADGDWRDQAGLVDGEAPAPATTITIETPRRIIARNTSPDVPFDRSINPWRGCEHGCIYCFARPTHAFHGLSPGLDFETRLFAKPTAPALLRAELMAPGYRPAPIAMGTNTDCWQPAEARLGIARAVLQVLAEFRHPVAIVTKAERILRDLDILAPMAAQGLVHVGVSLTTLDPVLARRLEPRACAPARRLAAIRALRQAGVPAFAIHAPMIPALNDHELERLMAAAAEAGALTASWIPLRLPHEVAPLFRDWLEAHYPDRAGRVMAQVRAMRGGRDNDPRFGSRMRGSGPWAEMMRARFVAARRRLGLEQRLPPLRTDLFRRP